MNRLVLAVLLVVAFLPLAGVTVLPVAATPNALAAPAAASTPQEASIPADDSPFELLSATGGQLTSVVVSDTVALLAEGEALQVVDVADPRAPRRGTRLELDATAYALRWQGATAYALTTTGLQLIDTRNPRSPRLLGRYAVVADTFASFGVVGNTAYLPLRERGMQIVNTSDPLSPTLVGSFDTPEPLSRVAVANGRAYALSRERGMQILDVANPARPTALGRLDAIGSVRDVALQGSTAYIASTWLDILDLDNASAPRTIGRLRAPADAYVFEASVAISGSVAFLTDTTADRFATIDVTNPQTPTLGSTYTVTPSVYPSFFTGGRAYLNNGTILSLSTPLSPTLLGSIPLSDTG